ncbi:MAG: hypothetical protein CMI54_09025 [Parcubacteria group bacterium]|jgi:hypothetical protein|nr:hypothetical protein [Parcubacteria group bacterium]
MAQKKTEKNPRGIRTSEFWLTALTSLVGLLIMAGVVNPEGAGTSNQVTGFVVAALASVGYTVSRGIIKSKND